MWTEFTHTIKKMTGAILGWGLGFALLGAFLIPFYNTFAKAVQINLLNQMLKVIPKELMVFFGDITAISSPQGYLTIEYFSYIPIILGIFAISACSGLLSRDEERGILDITLSHPVKRWQFFLARFIAFTVALILILFIAWLGIVIPINAGSFPLEATDLARPFVSLFAVLMLFGGIALMFSQFLPSADVASWIAGAYMVTSFFITSLARLDKNLEVFDKFSVLKYYQSGDAISGLKWEWALGLLVVALVMAAVGLWQFTRRDIRVGGEGSLGLPAWLTMDFYLGKSKK